MTISFRAAGTLVSSTLTPAPSYPSGVQATDLNVLTIMAKPNSNVQPESMTCSVPSGWGLIFQGSSGNEAPNTPEASSGSNMIWVYTRTGGAYTGSVTVTLTGHSVAAAVINTYAGTAGGWNTSVTYGYDNDSSGLTYDSNRTVASSNLGLTTGDWLIITSGLTNSSGIGTATVTATGTTLNTPTVRQQGLSQITTPDTTTSYFDYRDTTVASGTSTAGPKLTSTQVQDGLTVFILLREGIRTISGSETSTFVEKSSLGAALDLPVPRTWANGDFLDAATLNAAWRDPIAWVMTEAPGVQLEVTQVVTFNATTHTITWDKIRYRRGSIVVSGTKVSVPTTGHYVGQFSIGLRDNGTMGYPFVITVDILTYPGGTGAATVHNVSVNYDPLDAETNIAIGSQPFSLYLNQGDAIEVRLSGAWNTAGGTQLWVASDAAASTQGFVPLLDLHWFSTWDGVSR